MSPSEILREAHGLIRKRGWVPFPEPGKRIDIVEALDIACRGDIDALVAAWESLDDATPPPWTFLIWSQLDGRTQDDVLQLISRAQARSEREEAA